LNLECITVINLLISGVLQICHCQRAGCSEAWCLVAVSGVSYKWLLTASRESVERWATKVGHEINPGLDLPLCRGTGAPPPSTNTGAPWPLRNFLINKQQTVNNKYRTNVINYMTKWNK